MFDLKAVNPKVVTKVDMRTPQQIIENIEVQVQIVTDALSALKKLLVQTYKGPDRTMTEVNSTNGYAMKDRSEMNQDVIHSSHKKMVRP